MNKFQTQLKGFTEKVAENLYKYKSSTNILYTISESAQTDEITKYGNFFFTTQQLCIQSAILSMTKIFELDKKSAHIHSINNFIKSNIKYLPILGLVHENSYKYFKGDFNAYKVVFNTKYDDDGILISSKTENILKESFPCTLIDILDTTHKHIIDNYTADINALKGLRDSKIAHSDKKAIEIQKTTWERIDELSKYVSEYLDIIEHTFLATSRSIDYDAKRHSNSLKRLLLNLEEKA